MVGNMGDFFYYFFLVYNSLPILPLTAHFLIPISPLTVRWPRLVPALPSSPLSNFYRKRSTLWTPGFCGLNASAPQNDLHRHPPLTYCTPTRRHLTESMTGHLENSHDMLPEPITIQLPGKDNYDKTPPPSLHRLGFFVSIPARLFGTWYIFEHSSWNTPIGWGSAGFHLKPGATVFLPKALCPFPVHGLWPRNNAHPH